MPTLTDTKFNHALVIPAVAGEPPVPEILITRPHADGVVTDNKDPDSSVDTSADGIVPAPHEDFSSYVTNGTTGTVSHSGNHVGLTDITDGTSNTIAFARTDGNAASLLETMADDDNALFKGSVVNINASGGWDPTMLFESPQTEAADDSTARRAGISDGTSNTIMIGELSATGNVIENVATKYTMFDGEADGLLLGGNGADRLVRVDDLGIHSVLGGDVLDVADLPVVLSAAGHSIANGPAGNEILNGNINNIDAWVGGVVLDVGDVLGGADAADGDDAMQTHIAGGRANPQPDPEGQANGIIAVLIGVSADDQGPLNNAGLALD